MASPTAPVAPTTAISNLRDISFTTLERLKTDQ
jgi:hypothetical protein